MAKRTDSTMGWIMFDAARDTYNVVENILYADSTAAEATSGDQKLDFTATGFKVRGSGAWLNASGGNFIFMAFAECPLGGDGVAQGLAR
jgi:hypothetical protein